MEMVSLCGVLRERRSGAAGPSRTRTACTPPPHTPKTHTHMDGIHGIPQAAVWSPITSLIKPSTYELLFTNFIEAVYNSSTELENCSTSKVRPIPQQVSSIDNGMEGSGLGLVSPPGGTEVVVWVN